MSNEEILIRLEAIATGWEHEGVIHKECAVCEISKLHAHEIRSLIREVQSE